MSTYYGEESGQQNDRVSESIDGKIVTRVSTGIYSVLEGDAPTVGETIDALLVQSYELTPEPGGMATLTITLVAPGQPKYALDFHRVDIDLRRHPIYATGGDKVLTKEQRLLVDSLLQDPTNAKLMCPPVLAAARMRRRAPFPGGA